MTTPIAKNPTPRAPEPRAPEPRDPVESIQRGLARLREVSLRVQTEPLKEMRLEMGFDVQIVYFAIRLPVAGGVRLRLPVLTTITPKFYSRPT